MDRRGYIGSSDIAAILGISPWSTPYQTWLEKTSEVAKADNPSAVMKRGVRIEKYVIEQLQEQRDFWVVDRNKRVPHPDHPFLWAESDFTYVIDQSLMEYEPPISSVSIGDRIALLDVRVSRGNIGHGEAKSIGYTREGWGPDGSQEIPAYYLAQVMFALACNGLSEATVAAAFSYDELRLYNFPAAPDLQAVLVKAAVDFWQNHVLAGVPPPAKTLDDSKLMLEKLGGFQWEASEKAAALATLIRNAKGAMAAAGKKVEELEKEFLDLMLSAAAVHGVTEDGTKNYKAVGPDGKAICTYNTITRKGYTVSETTYKQLRWSK